MESMFRWLGFLIILLLGLAGFVYWSAGQTTPPTITIEQPAGPVGQQGTLQFTVGTGRAIFAGIDATLEQNGKTYPGYRPQISRQARPLSGRDRRPL